LTGKHRYFRYHIGAAAHESGEFFGNRLSAYGTFVYIRGPCRNRNSVPVASGKPAAAAVSAGQTVPYPPNERINGYGEDFFEEAKGKTKNKRQNKREYRSCYDYHIHFLTVPNPKNR
jgi:hypothetical protein